MKKIFLVPLVVLSLMSCKQERKAESSPAKDAVTDPQVEELESQLDQLQEQLIEERNLRLREDREQVVLLSEMKGLLKEIAQSSEEKPIVEEGRFESEPEGLEKMSDDYLEARRIARLKAEGEKHRLLTTASGVDYDEVVISRVTDIGVVFRHKSGVARVSFSDLPRAWRERFYYDADRALLAQENERLAQIRYDQATAVQVAALEKQRKQELENAEKLHLERQAQLAKNLDRSRIAQNTVVREQIYVAPPIVVNQRPHYASQLYCPPIVRTPYRYIPTVRYGTGTIQNFTPSIVTPGYCPPVVRPTVQRPSSRPTPIRPSVQRPRVVTPRQVTSRTR